MTDVTPDPLPATFSASPDPGEAAVARKNMAWGWMLFGFFWLLFAGTFGVAYVWMWLS